MDKYLETFGSVHQGSTYSTTRFVKTCIFSLISVVYLISKSSNWINTWRCAEKRSAIRSFNSWCSTVRPWGSYIIQRSTRWITSSRNILSLVSHASWARHVSHAHAPKRHKSHILTYRMQSEWKQWWFCGILTNYL